MFLSSKTLWRAGPLSKPLASIVHVRQPGNRLHQQFQQQSRDISTFKRGKRIHIAGAIYLQTLLANALAQSADSKQHPITLMVPANAYLQHYVDTNGSIQIIQNGIATSLVGAVDIEVLPFTMEFPVPEQTFPAVKHHKIKRLLLDTDSGEEDHSIDDLPSLLENGPILDFKKKKVINGPILDLKKRKPLSQLPISDIGVYDLSFFLELNKQYADYPSSPKIDVEEERVVEIRPPPKRSDIDAVPVTHMAKINNDPIDCLIYGERPKALIEFFKNIKYRLHPSSVVMIIGNQPGLVETLYNEVFPDVSTRPNFIECTNGMYMGETSLDGFWDSPRSIPVLKAQLSLGPLARTRDDGQTDHQVNKRNEEIKYLVKRVLDAPALGAETIDREKLEIYKLKKLVAKSVIYPLTVAFNCMMGEIFSTEERVAEARLLFDEACAVVQATRPELTRRYLLTALLWQVIRAPGIHPFMWKCVQAGYSTNIDLDNGWIISGGKGMTPTHVKYSKIVKEKARESAKAIAAEREETARAEARLRMAKEKAARRLEGGEKRLEHEELLYIREMMRQGFKRFTFKPEIEAPLNVPDKTYFKSSSPTEASSMWEKLEVPRNNGKEEGDGSDSSAPAERNQDDVVENTVESGDGEEKPRG